MAFIGPGARIVVVGWALLALATGCHAASGTTSATDQAFLSEVHGADPNINAVRSDTQLVRLGHAVCDDFRAKASYQAVADRLSITTGSNRLPTADLGAVITAAADSYCPQYRAAVS